MASKPITLPKGKKTLAGVVGTALGAALLFVVVPADESGRQTKATVNADQSITLQHIAGKQYLKAYLDIVKVPTICDGITKGVKLGQTATETQCAVLLEEELIAHAEPIIKCVPALKGRTYQVVAGVGLTYNVGTNGFCGSSIARLWNQGKWVEGCDFLLKYNRAGGQVVRGLVLRRNREREMCLTGLVAGKTQANLDQRMSAWRK